MPHEAMFTIPDGVGVMDFLTKPRISEPTLREATAAYLDMKGKADSIKFTRPIELAVTKIIKQSGNKLLSAYTRNDAIQFRDSLIKRKVSLATVKRNLSVIRSIWNFASREHGINTLNPFANMLAKGFKVLIPCSLDAKFQILRITDRFRFTVARLTLRFIRLSRNWIASLRV